MATLPRCLCLILTLWMVCSRPSATVRTGSPIPGSTRGGKTLDSPYSALYQAAVRYRLAGDFAASENAYQQGYRVARQRGDLSKAERYLTGVAGCRMAQFQYRTALEAYLEARDLARSIDAGEDLSAINFNLSSLYLQVWDFDSALRAAEDALRMSASLRKPYFKPQLLLQLGRLHESRADDTAASFFKEGIEESRSQGNFAVEARAWDLLGEERLNRGRLIEAERDLGEAFRLRLSFVPKELGFSYGRLGALKLALGDTDAALMFTRRAISEATWPEYRLIHQRGRIRLARGEVGAALADFRKALNLAAVWRLEVLPAISSLVGANEALDRQIFDAFIGAGAHEALRAHNRRLAAETFEVTELNRASSLRENISLADVWRRKLPPEYWERSGRLRAEEAKLLRTGGENSPEAEHLRLKLTEMEAGAGLGVTANPTAQTSLVQIQQRLDDSEALLSFHLGQTESYLWAVTRQTLTLYRLGAAKEIGAKTTAFRKALLAGSPEAERLGEQLHRDLFGQLGPAAVAKPSWLLSLEGALFDVPFAALVTGREAGKPAYLVEMHSLQVVPGALLLRGRSGNGDGSFLGVGDPIYNSADPRSRSRRASVFELFAAPSVTSGQLCRLVASAREVQSSARSWLGQATLLQGGEAHRDRFLKALTLNPSVIHLAIHVLTPAKRPEEAFLAFSLGSSGEAEYLTTSDVAMLKAPGALVVMTGCDTGAGQIRPGAGILGLPRAWQMAGASAVVATAWPVRDSAGEIFSSFYNHLRGASPAEALRRSQIDMLRSGTLRAAPEYWASYQVTGSTR